ncbi:MAG TPA: POTRA domain-containing protein [Pyrinomonadaceae bacterium]|nr:POTRA domain-containing protein [Pyrinomonadaceae bacterium]
MCLLLLSSASSPARAQQPQGAQQTLKLERIEFKGLARVTEAEALEKSGLQAGQTVSIEQVDAAADRLLSSGLFEKLSYNVKGQTDKAVVTFTVVEPKWSMPVAFDNFVWFTDEELRDAVKRRVPTFDGTAPQSGGVTEQIRQALEDLLRERKVEGTVEYTLSSDASGRKIEHLFSVRGPELRVCKLSFVGAHAVPEETLRQKSGGIFDNDYSRAFIEGFAEANLLPLYQERGYLRASFAPPKVKPDSSADCDKGVAVTMYVDEGSIYVWDKAVWAGASALTPQELDAALGMREREVANRVKIDKGLAAVGKAYARKGYLGASVRAAPDFDDENRRVAFRLQVEEGPQYHMGELTINGLSEADANNLHGRWRLLHGDVYEEGYPDEFVKKSLPEFYKDELRAGHPLPALKMDIKATPDREKQTVDVTISFKPTSATANSTTP